MAHIELMEVSPISSMSDKPITLNAYDITRIEPYSLWADGRERGRCTKVYTRQFSPIIVRDSYDHVRDLLKGATK